MKQAANRSEPHRFVHYFGGGRGYAIGTSEACGCGCHGWEVEWNVVVDGARQVAPAVAAELLAVSRAYADGGLGGLS